MPINTAEALRETAETIAAVNAYVERVATKDAEQEASIATLRQRVTDLEAQIGEDDPEVVAAFALIASELDALQKKVAEPVEPPEVPEPEEPSEGAPTEGD